MKIQTIRNLSVALLAASSLFAQAPHTLKFEVPFGFHVGEKMLPSGQYTVDSDITRGIVMVRSADSKTSAMILSVAIGPPANRETGKLIFSRYGDQYFLSQVWGPNYDGRLLRKSKREKEEAASLSRDAEIIVAAK